MKSPTRFLVFLIALIAAALPAFGDDQQKAQKELNQITAMARDFTRRTVVNLTMSQTLSVPRATLVQQRTDTGLNYGSLFLAGELVKNGATMPDIAAQLKNGKKITEIANGRNVNWKQIVDDAKKLNSAVDQNLYKYFLREKGMAALNAKDKYDVHYDGVKADADDANEKEIEMAQGRYLRWKEQAAKAQGEGRDKGLSLEDERIGYIDHTGGPGATGAGGRGQTGPASTNTGTGSPAGFGGPQ
jgi:hypothetical protein